MKISVCLPTFANPGRIHFRTPNLSYLTWDNIIQLAKYAEANSMYGLFVPDHLVLGQNGEIYECMVTLAALATATNKVKLFPIHLCDAFRNPRYCMKQILTINEISKGRMGLFYDYGWREKEFDLYRYEFKSTETRIEDMVESLELFKQVISPQSETDLEQKRQLGMDFKYSNNIPIWLGEANEALMVDAIVKHADCFNSMPCSPASLKIKINTVKNACIKNQRDISSLDLSLETQLLIRPTKDSLNKTIKTIKANIVNNNSQEDDIISQLKVVDPLFNEDSLDTRVTTGPYMFGTPDQIKDKLNLYRELGITSIMVWPVDYPCMDSLEYLLDILS